MSWSGNSLKHNRGIQRTPAKYILTNHIPKNAFPQLKEDIVFTLPGRNFTIAEAASPDFEGWKKLKITVSEKGTTVTLPKELLQVYTIIRVK